MMEKIKFLAILWTAIVSLMIGILSFQLYQGMQFETNILALLPQTKQDPVIQQALDSLTSNFERRIILLVGHANKDTALKAADTISQNMMSFKGIKSLNAKISSDSQLDYYKVYHPHRYRLLAHSIRSLLVKEHGGELLLNKSLQNLYSPMGLTSSALLKSDPLLLFPAFVMELPKASTNLVFEDGYLIANHNGINYIFLTALLDFNPFSSQDNKRLVDQIFLQKQASKKRIEGLHFLTAGTVFHAYQGERSARQEISTIGLGSLLGIILLIVIVFKSIRPLLVIILPILSGFLCALVLSNLIFTKIHLITLVFGASLTGISVDYSFHYYSWRLLHIGKWDSGEALKKILPGISLGLITTVIGYSGFFVAPFPGLRQMAFFSTIGIIAAWLSVVCWFPFLVKSQQHTNLKLIAYMQSIMKTGAGFRSRRNYILLAVFSTLLISIGFWRLNVDDDIRLLNNSSSDLMSQENLVREVIGSRFGNSFLLVEGADFESLLQNEEEFLDKWGSLYGYDSLSEFQYLSALVPSIRRQKENHALLLRSLLGSSHLLQNYLLKTGFDQKIIQTTMRDIRQKDLEYLSLDSWLGTPIAKQFSHLWLGKTERGYATLILTGNIKSEQQLIELSQTMPQVSYINKTAELSQVFQQFRYQASLLLFASYLLILMLIVWRYGLKRGLMVMLGPVLATIYATCVIALGDQVFNLFNTLALLLVLGIGIDYSIFFEESMDHSESTLLAIILSAITTLLSFGLLFFSDTPVLKSFGLTVLTGIIFALVFAVFFAKNEESPN